MKYIVEIQQYLAGTNNGVGGMQGSGSADYFGPFASPSKAMTWLKKKGFKQIGEMMAQSSSTRFANIKPLLKP